LCDKSLDGVRIEHDLGIEGDPLVHAPDRQPGDGSDRSSSAGMPDQLSSVGRAEDEAPDRAPGFSVDVARHVAVKPFGELSGAASLLARHRRLAHVGTS
jgi:hypothetical protein